MTRSRLARVASAATFLCLGACATDPSEPQLESVRLTYLDVRYDLDQPVFVNNRIPVTFGLTATSVAGAPATQQVAVGFSLIEAEPADPASPRGCASSAMNVEVIGNGEEQLFSGFIWPTTLCHELAGRRVYIHVEFDGGEEAETELDAPSVTFTPDEVSSELNQLCRSADDSRGCVYAIDLEPTPSGAGGALIDVRHADMVVSSSVAVLPPQREGAEDAPPLLALESTLVVNGRDPYIAPTAPEDVPAGLEALEPGITQDLRFGVGPDDTGVLTAMPGRASLRYEIAPTGATTGFRPLTIGARDAEPTAPHAAELAIDHLLPGTTNIFASELFAEGETLTALAAGGEWAELSDFDVRGCFDAEFEQAGNAGDGGASDCRVVPVVLVREAPAGSAAVSFGFDAELSRSVGGSRLSLDASLSTQNHLDSSGASTRTEGLVEINGSLGRSFRITVARALARASLGIESGAGYELSIETFGDSLLSRSLEATSIEHEEDYSFGRSFAFPGLGFGFGPVRIGIGFSLGGEVGLATGDSLSVSAGAACSELLGTDEAIATCGSVSRHVTPRFAFTAVLEGGIDIRIARAGVEASLRIVETDFPLTAQLAFGVRDDGRVLVGGNVSWELGLTLIQGDVAIVGRVGIRRFSRTLRVNLFSFSSPRITRTLLDRSLALEVLD